MPIPIIQHVINLIHKMADNDGMTDGLKIQNHHGVVLYDSSWIVGGDYEQDEDYEEQDNEEEDDDYLEEEYDKVDPNELVDILEDNEQELIASNANPVKVEEDEEQDTDAVKVKDEVQEDYEQEEPPQQEEEEVEEGINEHQALMM
jgi:hypothetical protein